MAWQKALEKALADAPGVFGVAAEHLETGESAGQLDDQLFQLASAFKIPIMVTLMREVEAGRVRLDQRVVTQKTRASPVQAFCRSWMRARP